MARLSKTQLKALLATQLPDNMDGEVSVADVRGMFNDLIDSLEDEGGIIQGVRSLTSLVLTGQQLALNYVDADGVNQTKSVNLPTGGGDGVSLARPTQNELRTGVGQSIRGYAPADVNAQILFAFPADYAEGVDDDTTADTRLFSPSNVFTIAASQSEDQITEDVEGWALKDTTTQIPANRLQNAPSSSGGRTEAQVNKQIEDNPKILELEEFEDALRKNSNIIANYRITQATSNASTRIGNVLLPSAEAERELIITVTDSNAVSATQTFDLSEIRNKPAITSGDQLSASNAVTFEGGGNNYYIAHSGGNNQLFFASDNIGSYNVTVTDSRVNVTDFVRDLPASRVTGLEGGGQTAQQVSDAIQTHANLPNVHHTPPEDEFTQAQRHKILEVAAAFDDGGWGTLNGAEIASTTSSSRPTASQIQLLTFAATRTNPSPAAAGQYVSFRVPIAKKGEADAGKVRVAEYGTEGDWSGPEGTGESTADSWVVSTATHAYYAVLIADLAADEILRVQELDPFELDPRYVQQQRFISATHRLADRESQGIPITSAASPNRSALYGTPDETYTIGTKEGRVDVRVEWSILGGVNMQLGDSTTDSEFVFLSDITASTAYAATGDVGIKMSTVELQNSSGSKIGDVSLYLGQECKRRDWILFGSRCRRRGWNFFCYKCDCCFGCCGY